MLKHNEIYCCDALSGVRKLGTESVQCCITSPPYYKLRDYAITSQIGQEHHPSQYLTRLLNIFDELKRVLAPDGVLWVNLSDSYQAGSTTRKRNFLREVTPFYFPPDLPSKSLLSIPWRFAIAMQEHGWILRQDIIWAKRNPMPESVKDRCTRSHEYIFMFVKQPRYFYNADAIKTPAAASSISRLQRGVSSENKYSSGIPGNSRPQSMNKPRQNKSKGHGRRYEGFDQRYQQQVAENGPTLYCNMRSVWQLHHRGLKEKHYAAFPIDLPDLCIKASTRPGDLVLDIFMGSGTTALAAGLLGRRFVGFDLNPDYVEIAKNRLRKTMGLFLR